MKIMMNQIRILLILIVFIYINLDVSYSQCYLNNFNLSTKHNSNNKFSHKPNYFNWESTITTQTYDINGEYFSNPNLIQSPFFNYYNSLMSDHVTSKNMKNDDGWELILEDFGFDYDLNGVRTNSATKVINPYVILYNKYLGLLRVFVCIGKVETGFPNSVIITMKDEIFRSNTLHEAGILPPYNGNMQVGEPNVPLDKAFEIVNGKYVKANLAVASTFSNSKGQWFYADFNMNYDPCVCLFNSNFSITVELVSSANIQLESSTEGDITHSNTTKSDAGSYSFGLKDLINGGKAAQQTYKDISSFKDNLNGFFEEKKSENKIFEAKKDEGKEGVNVIKNASIEPVNTSNNGLEELKKVLNYVPYVGAAVSLISSFTSGGQKEPDPLRIQPLVIKTHTKTNGTFTANQEYAKIELANPGSLNSETIEYRKRPYYNYPLGVFTLVKTPKLKYKQIIKNELGTHESIFFSCKLESNLEYTYNKSAVKSGSIPKIFASLMFEVDTKYAYYYSTYPSVWSPEVDGKIRKIGHNYANEYTKDIIVSEFLPLECFSNERYCMKFDMNNWTNSTIFINSIYIKLMFVYEPNFTTINKPVILSQTYKVILGTNETGTLTTSQFDSECSNLLSTTKQYVNATTNQDYQVYQKITFPVNTTPKTFNNINAKAGKSILVNAGNILSNNTLLKIEQPYTCSADALNPMSESALYNFCNSNTTGTYNYSLRMLNDTISKSSNQTLNDKINNPNNTNIFPNPSSEKISLDLGGVAVADLVVYDILGNEIMSIPNYTNKSELDLSTLSIGTYTIQIQTSTGIISQRFVKY